jgi:hypothetical protein
MEKRANQRLPYRLDAKIISEGKTYDGTIENVSQGGMEYLMTSLVEAPKDVIPDKVIDVNFQAPSGETVNVTCRVKWYLEVDPNNRTLMLGMEILNPHRSYNELIKNLIQ